MEDLLNLHFVFLHINVQYNDAYVLLFYTDFKCHNQETDHH